MLKGMCFLKQLGDPLKFWTSLDGYGSLILEVVGKSSLS